MKPSRHMRHATGFAMLEILVSMIVIMIGVLGIAGIQMLSINNTEIARYQSLATILASGMAAEIQANPAYWATSTANITISGGVVTGGPAAGNCNGGNGGGVCTPTQMAGYDLQNFATGISSVLPSGQGSIACTVAVGAPTVCALQLSWTEKNVALNNPSSTATTSSFASGTAGTQSYQTEVPVQ